jgi:hypothetical protein
LCTSGYRKFGHMEKKLIQGERQFTYKGTVRRFRVIIIVVAKELLLCVMSGYVCNLSYPALKAHAQYCIVI